MVSISNKYSTAGDYKVCRSRFLKSSTSTLTVAALIALAGGVSAVAQDAPSSGPVELEQISVTATRIQRSGFEAPSPVTVLDAAELQNRGVPSIATILNELPAFRASTTPATTGQFSLANGSNSLDIRGLGSERTLVLINGRRHVSSTRNGVLNINVIPSALIERVEIVTGGASAAWGSDAVAGVANIIFDRSFQGMKAEAQYGISEEGDYDDYKFSVAYGDKFENDRGHFSIAAEYHKNEGIFQQTDRKWGAQRRAIIPNPADTGPNDGIPARLITDNVSLFVGTEGGVILGPGPISFIEFGPGGAMRPFQLGSLVIPPYMVGGSGANLGDYTSLAVPYDQKNLYTTFEYEVFENVNFFFEGSYAETQAESRTVQTFDFPVTIQSGNPFIPTGLQDILTANSIGAFGLYRVNTDLGFVTADTTNDTFRTVFGFNGTIFNDWSWEVYYQYGKNKLVNSQLNNRITQNFLYAVDVVEDPVTGDPVCAATLSGLAPGCQPLDLFGAGSPSQAAIDYVNATGLNVQKVSQQVISGSLSGTLFEGWAGPVSLAFGAEYRKEKASSQTDPISEARGYTIYNGDTVGGSYDVKEMFAETVIPLLKDLPLVKSLEFNGAVRLTDYSLSGTVTTWKTGLTYAPSDDVRFRGTISRDIRAPNINELFSQSGLIFASILDPETNSTVFVPTLRPGNTSLSPEKADTRTFGVVYQPGWMDGLRLSVDWYDIKVKDAIDVLSGQQIVDLCHAGNSSLCGAITRDSNGVITQVISTRFNVAERRVSGVDFEGLYNFNLDNVFSDAGGNVTLRVLGTYVDKLETSPDGIVRYNRAGEVGPNNNGVPHWRLNGSITYNTGPLTIYTQARYVGSGNYDNTYGPEDIDNNRIGAQWYFNMSGRYLVHNGEKAAIELYAGVDNVFDNTPPNAPVDFLVPLGTNPVLYDVIGRYFYTGIRAKF